MSHPELTLGVDAFNAALHSQSRQEKIIPLRYVDHPVPDENVETKIDTPPKRGAVALWGLQQDGDLSTSLLHNGTVTKIRS